MSIELIIFISAISIIVAFAGFMLLLNSKAHEPDKECEYLTEIPAVSHGCSESVYEYRKMLAWIDELTKPAKAKKQLPRNRRTHNIKSLTNKGQL